MNDTSLVVKIRIKTRGFMCAEDCPWLDWRDGYHNGTPKCRLFLERSGRDREFAPVRLCENRRDCKDGHTRGVPYRQNECLAAITTAQPPYEDKP